jgi:hypothetical protein
MRLIKLVILSFVFLFLVVTAISLLIPSHIRISKATNIGHTKDSIFALIKDEGRWSQWHPAFMNDTLHRMAAIQVRPVLQSDSEVVFQLQQPKKRPVINGWKIYHTSADSLTLQWYMDFHLHWYPWEKFGSLFYENTYGVMMEQGLTNLKRLGSYYYQ